MIGRGEVTKTAQAEGVDARTIERDYVLAHVAVGIADVAGESLVLKGERACAWRTTPTIDTRRILTTRLAASTFR